MSVIISWAYTGPYMTGLGLGHSKPAIKYAYACAPSSELSQFYFSFVYFAFQCCAVTKILTTSKPAMIGKYALRMMKENAGGDIELGVD